MSYENELRRTADEFLLTVHVAAEHFQRPVKDILLETLEDARARLAERGFLLGKDEEE